MEYRGFYITRCAGTGIEREDKSRNIVMCDGFFYQIYTNRSCVNEIDNFCGAIGFELPDGSDESANLFAQEMIDLGYKEYCRIKDELTMGGVQQ